MSKKFDFQLFIRRQKSVDARDAVLHFEDYAFIEDMRQRRRLAQFSAIRKAIVWFGRYWLLRERRVYLRNCREVGKRDARLHSLWLEACLHFKVERPKLYLRQKLESWMTVLGLDDEPFVVLRSDIAARSRQEILFVMGTALAAIHNGHATEMTILAFAEKFIFYPWQRQLSKSLFALISWNELAHITRDRGGLLLCRDQDAAIIMIALERLDWEENEIRAEISRMRENKSVDWEDKALSQRLLALEIFMQSKLYQSATKRSASFEDALTLSVVDERVQNVLGLA